MRALLLVLTACGRFGFDGADGAITPSCVGHDEDGDTIPDACDVCPTVSDANQPDGDGDGVGDACDPRPLVAGDFILQFEPHDDASAARYESFNNVEWRNDTVRLGTLTDAGSLLYALDTFPSRIAVHTHVIDASTMQQWFGFWYRRPTTAEDPKIFASAAYSPPATSVAFSLKEQDGAGNERFCPDEARGPAMFAAGQSYTIVVDTSLATGGDDHIVFNSATQAWECHLAAQIPTNRGGFLEAHRVIVDFDYFIAYGVR